MQCAVYCTGFMGKKKVDVSGKGTNMSTKAGTSGEVGGLGVCPREIFQIGLCKMPFSAFPGRTGFHYI